MEIGERVLAARFEELLPHLDERRLVLGAEARWLGHGGSSWSRRRRGGAQGGAGGGG